ncbi:hypothetical protein K470DRAFT_256141 [Piedraia hortae CBS 480.64]|uniref:Uncharacterized protein n=1 Tax=Piedraia hortae CBS 480.64 TaxID=1314780 RepID=A0A6A7C536_9PEZI|nr:hypothetical protein K470DRAFT_256141 [Piedraia hortae CBS 480.64]
MAPWQRILEAFLIQHLLRSPTFHRGVEKVARKIHQIRTGAPPPQSGLEQEGQEGFLVHFKEALNEQISSTRSSKTGDPAGVNIDSRAMGHQGKMSSEEKQVMREDAKDSDAAWEEVKRKMKV